MLDTDTKRRIDTARDILVGKVPDPKSQVEQVTIALIYKFMDDLDAESEELGGQRKFFADGFADYGWAKLMRPGLGGHETLNLYAEAITRMPENPGIPPLFRDIFNNAYLPYRDPETLRSFLKVIDGFTYDHSERLGDAFEYLLSVLGSQGDAGQFRTPRHIIDFIVKVVDPKKDDVILDPACGTAGFLISSYKHIVASNTKDGINALTPDERGRLAGNFKGYDISPDMVRLSLVNMYLHGFATPHIFEYDTLTSEDRWNEYADVILANPPFMSPKGGIRPHNRFSVKSKRSEVLFVDYMAEHLTPTGRAGIIVPEGIIFQSQKAHQQLRKRLVEDFLVAVVSLPAGVFNPYSGVKTSILILDRALAKRTDRIAFFKVENDGFDLGAQRRPIGKNDLPAVQTELAEYLRRIQIGEPLDDFDPSLGLIVQKGKITEETVWLRADEESESYVAPADTEAGASRPRLLSRSISASRIAFARSNSETSATIGNMTCRSRPAAARTIALLEEAGLAGCHLEDQESPKRCGHLDRKTLVPTAEMVRRVRAAAEAQSDPDFLLIARTDARAPEGLEKAIDRAKAYVDAGAAMIFPEALQDEREFEAFRAAIDAPLMANMTEFGKSPLLSRKALEGLGYNLVIYPVTTFRLAMKAVEDGLRDLDERDDQPGLVPRMMTRAHLYDIVDYADYGRFDSAVRDFSEE